MAITAGALSIVTVGGQTASLAATAATGGTGPYTYQWYQSTTSGFVPGVGNIVAGATTLTYTFSGLNPNVTYYYKVVATDTGHSNDEVTYTQLVVSTTPMTLSQNQFAQSEYVGTLDLRFNTNTIAVQIDVSQATPLYNGSPVKMVASAGGVPKVVGCTADADNVLGFINYDLKSANFVAGSRAEISLNGNVMYLFSTGAISRGAQVTLDVAGGGVATKTPGDNIVGWAFDQFPSAGSLGRIFITTPSFTTAS